VGKSCALAGGYALRALHRLGFPSKGSTFETGDGAIESPQRIAFKRSKLDIKIVKEAEEAKTKYDLFDRLNSGGAILSDQEFRNSLIVMSDPTFMDWLETIRASDDFQLSVAPSDKQSEEQYDLELVVRFLVLTNRSEEGLSQFKDLRELLTDSILSTGWPWARRDGSFRRLSLCAKLSTALLAPRTSACRPKEQWDLGRTRPMPQLPIRVNPPRCST
jgi:hypothetical protein